MRVVSDLRWEKIIPLCKVAQCALSDYLYLVFDDTCGQVVAADIDHFDIRFGNGCTGGNVACQPDNFGFSVRQAIDQRCDAETDRKCDDNANDPDYRAVSDRMGCVCFFLFHVFVLSALQEERHHHAKRNERHESKAFTAAAFLDFVIDQRKQYAGEESERKTDQSS